MPKRLLPVSYGILIYRMPKRLLAVSYGILIYRMPKRLLAVSYGILIYRMPKRLLAVSYGILIYLMPKRLLALWCTYIPHAETCVGGVLWHTCIDVSQFFRLLIFPKFTSLMKVPPYGCGPLIEPTAGTLTQPHVIGRQSKRYDC
jgi:hypothetical protein